MLYGSHDYNHNDIQHNDTQHNNEKITHSGISILDTESVLLLSVVMLSGAFFIGTQSVIMLNVVWVRVVAPLWDPKLNISVQLSDLWSISQTFIGDDISINSANVKLNINDVCNLISEHFN